MTNISSLAINERKIRQSFQRLYIFLREIVRHHEALIGIIPTVSRRCARDFTLIDAYKSKSVYDHLYKFFIFKTVFHNQVKSGSASHRPEINNAVFVLLVIPEKCSAEMLDCMHFGSTHHRLYVRRCYS